MRQKSILFFSCEPGGAEMLIPVIELVKTATRHKAIVLGYGYGGERFARKGIEYIEIDKVEKNDSSLFDIYKPDFLVTSATSFPERDMSEKYLWHNAKAASIPTLAFVDQWQNYAIRFSGVEPGERLAYQPDYINCIDEVGKKEMIKEGFDLSRLVELGHPYLSGIKYAAESVDGDAIRARIGIPGQGSISLFVSEAIAEHYGSTRGYDQYDALNLFFAIIRDNEVDVYPLVKLHPKDDVEKFRAILRANKELAPTVVSDELTSVECLAIADRVFGMTSIMLIEAYILEKHVVSLQPGLAVEDPFVLSRYGYVERIDMADETHGTKAIRPNTRDDRIASGVIASMWNFRKEEFLRMTERLMA